MAAAMKKVVKLVAENNKNTKRDARNFVNLRVFQNTTDNQCGIVRGSFAIGADLRRRTRGIAEYIDGAAPRGGNRGAGASARALAGGPGSSIRRMRGNVMAKRGSAVQECDCAERSWYGAEHDSACVFAGLPNPASKMQAKNSEKQGVIEHLDESDLATILAALRLFQREYEDCDSVTIADRWPMHFNVQVPGGERGGQDISEELVVVPQPLGSLDIDGLCERINFANVLTLPKEGA